MLCAGHKAFVTHAAGCGLLGIALCGLQHGTVVDLVEYEILCVTEVPSSCMADLLCAILKPAIFLPIQSMLDTLTRTMYVW